MEPYFAVQPSGENRIAFSGVRNVETFGCLGEDATCIVAVCETESDGEGILLTRVSADEVFSDEPSFSNPEDAYFLPHDGLVLTGDWAVVGEDGQPADWGVVCALWDKEQYGVCGLDSVWAFDGTGEPERLDVFADGWPPGLVMSSFGG